MKFFEREQIAEAWAAARWRPAESPIDLEAYRSELELHYRNGSVVAAAGYVEIDPDVAAMVANDNWKFSQLLDRIWTLSKILSPAKAKVPICDTFASIDVFELSALLARKYFFGGAYSTASHTTTAKCLELGAGAALAMLPAGGVVFASESAWCDFFMDIAWDLTVVAVGKDARITMLLATDTD